MQIGNNIGSTLTFLDMKLFSCSHIIYTRRLKQSKDGSEGCLRHRKQPQFYLTVPRCPSSPLRHQLELVDRDETLSLRIPYNLDSLLLATLARLDRDGHRRRGPARWRRPGQPIHPIPREDELATLVSPRKHPQYYTPRRVESERRASARS